MVAEFKKIFDIDSR